MLTVTHDPQAKLDYGWDWSDWLTGGDTITTATITATPTGATITDKVISVDGGSVTCMVVTTASCRLTCHITTVQGRQDDRSITLSVRDR